MVFFGEGGDTPLAFGPAILAAGAGPPRAAGAVGIEPDTALTALSPRTFAAHGCVAEALSTYPDPIEPLDGLVAGDLLGRVTNLRLHFPAVPPNGTLVVYCEPVGQAKPDADRIRWRSIDAEMGALRILARSDRVALTMTVAADDPWILEVDLGSEWRLAGAVWRPQHQRATLDWLRSSANWDIIDDRRSETGGTVTTSIDFDFELET